jgi:hypothetical protein
MTDSSDDAIEGIGSVTVIVTVVEFLKQRKMKFQKQRKHSRISKQQTLLSIQFEFQIEAEQHRIVQNNSDNLKSFTRRRNQMRLYILN